MQSRNLMQQNYLIPTDIVEKVRLEVEEKRAKSKSEVARRALAAYFGDDEYQRDKEVPARFKNAIEMFNILHILTDKPEFRGKKFEQFWLSYGDIMEVKFGRWSFALQALRLFSKMCRFQKHPFQFERVILEIPVPGTHRKQMSREGFNIFFETPVTSGLIAEMRDAAIKLTQMDDFEDQLLELGSDEIIKTTQDVAREHLMKKFGLGSDDGEGEDDTGFDTNE